MAQGDCSNRCSRCGVSSSSTSMRASAVARARSLNSEGYDVVGEAAGGADALSRTAQLVPELVLHDIQLPDIDGFTVAERLLARHPAAKIVLVSSRDRSTHGPRIEKSGVSGFVSEAELTGAALERLLE